MPGGEHDEPSSPGLSLTKPRHKCGESCSKPGQPWPEILLKALSEFEKFCLALTAVSALEGVWGQPSPGVIQIMGWWSATSSVLLPAFTWVEMTRLHKNGLVQGFFYSPESVFGLMHGWASWHDWALLLWSGGQVFFFFFFGRWCFELFGLSSPAPQKRAGT